MSAARETGGLCKPELKGRAVTPGCRRRVHPGDRTEAPPQSAGQRRGGQRSPSASTATSSAGRRAGGESFLVHTDGANGARLSQTWIPALNAGPQRCPNERHPVPQTRPRLEPAPPPGRLETALPQRGKWKTLKEVIIKSLQMF